MLLLMVFQRGSPSLYGSGCPLSFENSHSILCRKIQFMAILFASSSIITSTSVISSRPWMMHGYHLFLCTLPDLLLYLLVQSTRHFEQCCCLVSVTYSQEKRSMLQFYINRNQETSIKFVVFILQVVLGMIFRLTLESQKKALQWYQRDSFNMALHHSAQLLLHPL